jgi:hypothetical protein
MVTTRSIFSQSPKQRSPPLAEQKLQKTCGIRVRITVLRFDRTYENLDSAEKISQNTESRLLKKSLAFSDEA